MDGVEAVAPGFENSDANGLLRRDTEDVVDAAELGRAPGRGGRRGLPS